MICAFGMGTVINLHSQRTTHFNEKQTMTKLARNVVDLQLWHRSLLKLGGLGPMLKSAGHTHSVGWHNATQCFLHSSQLGILIVLGDTMQCFLGWFLQKFSRHAHYIGKTVEMVNSGRCVEMMRHYKNMHYNAIRLLVGILFWKLESFRPASHVGWP